MLSNLGKLVDLCKESAKLLVISAADAKCCINKNIGNIMVSCADTCEEAVECIVTAYFIVVGRCKSYTVSNVCCKQGLLFNTDNVAVCCLNSGVDKLDEPTATNSAVSKSIS